ncbi:MAG: MBL fold metallo-hydrolase [unclassified Hahellaceae]|nr:MBL fold metallo-hydrolase [Hahellaceae bacterium]|tara:strand:+ start:76322 stop:77266 length:945 start_codon:yes stop_codon:yes gene_type:complete
MNKQRNQHHVQYAFKSVCTAATFVGFAGVAVADDSHHQDKTAFTSSELKPGFVLLQGKGGNVLLSHGEDGLLLIDNDYTEMSPALETALKGYDGKLKYVFNTHWHGDHTGGNQALGEAEIIAHDNVHKRLSSRQEVKLFNMVSEPYPKDALPDITFDHGVTLRFNAETVNALHLPKGHTDGDSIIFFESANIVHMGDHFFAGMFPFVDVASGGNVRNMAENITSVLDRIDDKAVVVPGHGEVSDKQALIDFRNMLSATADEVEIMMKKGLSLETIQEKGLSQQWDKWGKGFINEKTWIGIVHDSLSKAGKPDAS